jgi:Icc-related predicted phosphoesterase
MAQQVKMKIVATSDTHLRHKNVQIQKGDVFVHAGDNNCMTETQLREFCTWVDSLKFKHKIIIAGNHDTIFKEKPDLVRKVTEENGIIYLEDSSVTIDGVKFYGSPWTPKYGEIYVFNAARSITEQAFLGFQYPLIEEKWAMIPEDTDVLITHGPPYDIMDQNINGSRCGCVELRKVVERVIPKVHIFGHIHEGYGKVITPTTRYFNVANLGFKRQYGTTVILNHPSVKIGIKK